MQDFHKARKCGTVNGSTKWSAKSIYKVIDKIDLQMICRIDLQIDLHVLHDIVDIYDINDIIDIVDIIDINDIINIVDIVSIIDIVYIVYLLLYVIWKI